MRIGTDHGLWSSESEVAGEWMDLCSIQSRMGLGEVMK